MGAKHTLIKYFPGGYIADPLHYTVKHSWCPESETYFMIQCGMWPIVVACVIMR